MYMFIFTVTKDYTRIHTIKLQNLQQRLMNNAGTPYLRHVIFPILSSYSLFVIISSFDLDSSLCLTTSLPPLVCTTHLSRFYTYSNGQSNLHL
jgi:hypothetical protein